MKADASIWDKGKVCPPERARGNDPHLMAQGFELPRPVMAGRARLHADQPGGKLAEERHHLAAAQPLADHHLPRCINAVDLENVLGQVKANRDNFTYGRLLFLVVAGNHNHGTIDAGG